MCGEHAVEEHVTDHVPRIGSADSYLCDSIMRSGFDAPFFREALGVLCGVISFPHMAFEGVFFKIVIRRADIGIVEDFANKHERGVVVARCVFAIYNNLHSVFVLEVEEGLLFVADHDNDVADSHGLKLFDLAFNKDFAAHLKQSLRALVGNGRETRREAGCKDNRVVYSIGLQCGYARNSESAAFDQAGSFTFFAGGVDRGKAKPGFARKLSLGKLTLLVESVNHFELVLGQHW